MNIVPKYDIDQAFRCNCRLWLCIRLSVSFALVSFNHTIGNFTSPSKHFSQANHNPTTHACACTPNSQQSTHGIATTAADANDLDDAGTQTAVGHDGPGVVLVHGEDGAGRPVLAAEAGERSALRPPPAGQGRGEGLAVVAGTAAAATKGNEQSRGRRGGGSSDRGNRMGRRYERIGRPDGRRGQAGEGQDGHGSSRVHHLWVSICALLFGPDAVGNYRYAVPRAKMSDKLSKLPIKNFERRGDGRVTDQNQKQYKSGF